MDAAEYETIARLEGQHWWYRGMAAISLALLARHTAERPGVKVRVLDAGCGTGGMLKKLSAFGAALGVDFHPLAVRNAQAYAPVARASVEHLPFGGACFHVVTSFDVLYHLAVRDDRQALAEFYRVLAPGGVLLVRVPAFEALRGAHDKHVHTRERYTAAQLANKLGAAGFDLVRLTYANFFLLPLILLRRRLQPASLNESEVTLPPKAVNWLLEMVLLAERWCILLVSLPAGVSLFALARKPGDAHAT